MTDEAQQPEEQSEEHAPGNGNAYDTKFVTIMVTGSRSWKYKPFLWDILDQYKRVVENLGCTLIVIQGGAEGADNFARQWCNNRGVLTAEINLRSQRFWQRYGRAAGHVRNAAMLHFEPEVVIGFNMGTPGTRGTLAAANSRKIRTMEWLEKDAVAWEKQQKELEGE